MKRRTLLFSVLQSLYWIGACLVYSYAERFLKAFGFETDAVGLIVAIAYGFAMVLQPVLAAAADRERTVTLRTAIAFGALLSCGIAAPLLFGDCALAVLAVLFGALSSVTLAIQPLVNAVGFHYANRGEAIDFSLARGAGSVAYALASLLLGALAAHGRVWMLVPYVAANAGLFCMALWFAPHRTGGVLKTGGTSLLGVIRRYPAFLLFCFGNFVLFIPHNFLNAYLASITGVTGGNMSVMLAVAALVEFPAMMAYSRIRTRVSDRVLLVVSASIFLLKTGLMLAAAYLPLGAWAVYLSSAMQMLCYAIFVPAAAYFANDSVQSSDQVKGQMLLTEATLLSGVVSMLFGGLSIRYLGVPVSLILCEALVLLGVILIAVSVRKRK